jgi:hypothetical protein
MAEIFRQLNPLRLSSLPTVSSNSILESCISSKVFLVSINPLLTCTYDKIRKKFMKSLSREADLPIMETQGTGASFCFRQVPFQTIT